MKLKRLKAWILHIVTARLFRVIGCDGSTMQYVICKHLVYTRYKNGGGWFRLCGRGYSWSETPSFSQRNKLAITYKLGKWWISPLLNGR